MGNREKLAEKRQKRSPILKWVIGVVKLVLLVAFFYLIYLLVVVSNGGAI